MRRLVLTSSALALIFGLSACTVPVPLSEADIQARIEADRAALFRNQEPADKPIKLAEATARALKYNLDHRLKVMESALAQGEADIVGWDMLPRVAANAGYTARSNEAGASSKSLLTGKQSLENSTSSDMNFETANLSMAWNVLDFGVTYLRSKQQADRKLIAEERKRKVVQNIVQDVRYAWWRALSAQRLLPKLEALQKQAQDALADSRATEKRQLASPVTALDYQLTLLETLRQIATLKRDLELAKAELASLMNLTPDSGYSLAEPGDGGFVMPKIPGNLADLQQAALTNRPELREEDYNQRITATETNKALLRLLPGLEAVGDLQYSGNSYLYHQSWVEGGLKLSWNLMNLTSAYPNYKLNEAREDLVKTKRQAFSMAVLTQVNVSWLRYRMATEEFALANEMNEVTRKLRAHSQSALNAKAEGGLEAIRRSSKALFVELQRDVSYAELQNSAGRLYSSMGLDPLPEKLASNDLPSVTAEVEKMLSAWESGEVTAPQQMVWKATVNISDKPVAEKALPKRQDAGVDPRYESGQAVHSWEDIENWFKKIISNISAQQTVTSQNP
jgi:multidrug efflux system outer membrane protein